ncbi:hypothetical protein [Kitasatospora sp. NPDC093558]|uniref:hypothetical protein n=1 Tax=Kitasatospora sp. NPDC093558 TaxID=3155201 RepID=UPI003442457F
MADVAGAGEQRDGCSEDELPLPVGGMTISVRTRRDVVVVDPERFLAAARAAFREVYPGTSEEDAHRDVRDVVDAAAVLLERDGVLAPGLRDAGASACGPFPGLRVLDRPDGLSPAGELQQIVLDDPEPLQDIMLFQLGQGRDLFALPPTESTGPTGPTEPTGSTESTEPTE